MPPTVLTGNETSIQNIDNNVREMDAQVHELEPNAAPLTALTRAMGTKPAGNPKVEWLENEAMPRLTTLSASAASNATSFGVTDNIFRVGDVLRVPAAGFGVLVTATATGSIAGVKIGGAAQATAAAAAEVFIVSSAVAEGATLREIKFTQLVTPFNYCQIFRTEWGITGTEDATEHYGGDERKRLQNANGIEHARKLEQSFFFGPRDIQGTPATQRTCGGLQEFITTNVQSAASMTEDIWQTILQKAFRFGSDNKVAYCSPKVLSKIEGYARANIRVVDSDAEVYGVKMRKYISGNGTVGLVRHPDWYDSAVYNGYCFIVDMDAIKERPLRPEKLRMNVHTPSFDGFQDEYLTETTLQVVHERRHMWVTGIT